MLAPAVGLEHPSDAGQIRAETGQIGAFSEHGADGGVHIEARAGRPGGAPLDQKYAICMPCDLLEILEAWPALSAEERAQILDIVDRAAAREAAA